MSHRIRQKHETLLRWSRQAPRAGNGAPGSSSEPAPARFWTTPGLAETVIGDSGRESLAQC